MDYHFVFQMEKLWFKEVHGLTQGPPVSAWFALPLCYGRELVLEASALPSVECPWALSTDGWVSLVTILWAYTICLPRDGKLPEAGTLCDCWRLHDTVSV